MYIPSLLYHTYLVCILFGVPSLHPFTFLMFFISCITTNWLIMEYVVILVAGYCGTRVQLHRTTREVAGPDHILTYNHDAAGHNTKHMSICR